MCSVLDIADRENYFIMLDERNSDGNLSKFISFPFLKNEN